MITVAGAAWLLLQWAPCGAVRAFPNISEAQTLDVGVCIAGLARTFQYKAVRDNVRRGFLEPFLKGLSYRTFFALGEADDPRPNSPFTPRHKVPKVSTAGLTFQLPEWQGECAMLEDGHEVTDSWGSCDKDAALRAFRSWPAGAPSKALSGEATGCEVSEKRQSEFTSGSPRWGWIVQRQQNCYNLLRQYEVVNAARFKRVLFMRPDLLFVGSVPSLVGLELHPDESLLPSGVVTQRFNDHMLLCPRASCQQWLGLASLLRNESSITVFQDKKLGLQCRHMWHDHLMYAALKTMSFREVFLPYTLMRGCPVGAECGRLRRWPELVSACNSTSAGLCEEL